MFTPNGGAEPYHPMVGQAHHLPQKNRPGSVSYDLNLGVKSTGEKK
jgi:hypothetical protein